MTFADPRTHPPAASMTAEQSTLGAILAASMSGRDPQQLAELVFAVASPPMFWLPGHQILAELLAAMAHGGVPIDPQTVLARLTASGELSRIGHGGGAYLATLMERAWTIDNALAYAGEVRATYARRQVESAALRVVQQAANPEVGMDFLTVELATALDVAQTLAEVGPAPAPLTVEALLLGEDTPDWLVPGLLERGERVMITGYEGLGKSELLAQLATCMAAGLHPFTGQPAKAQRVLVVDCENPRDQLRRRYRRHVKLVDAILRTPMDRGNLMIEVREEGLDLTGGDDVAWLDRLLRGAHADVLITGPLYKLHRANINDESAARALTHHLDLLRTRHKVALIIEAHAGQGEDSGGRRKLRPRGSSLFLGWPSIGIGMRPHRQSTKNPPNLVEVRAWRGQRESRDWPELLERGGVYDLPWMPTTTRHLEPETS